MRKTAAVVAGALLAVAGYVGFTFVTQEPVPSFREQMCGIPGEWLERMRRGYHPQRSGQVALLPRTPAYMATGAGGWSHSGPWPYLQDVPLVFYGPGFVEAAGDVDSSPTLADIAPTTAGLLKGSLQTEDGHRLHEVAPLDARSLARPRPRLVVTVVLDGGGWNVLEQWPDAWPNLARLMEEGVSYTGATVGSSPSVTPSVHTTIGTGTFPRAHGITGVPVRDDEGTVVDSFLEGESSRFMEELTLAELWDQQNGNDALVGLIGYEPWHLGMIGRGAEMPAGDKDHAAWLDRETNEWITNPDHYELPEAVVATGGLDDDLRDLDAADGEVDGAWGDHAILHDRSRVEETPAFIRYHGRALMTLVDEHGYGDDAVTDLLFTNFKQIDRVGHYFNMASEEVRESLEETDRQLGEIVGFLDERVGRDGYVVIVTADHGQQPDAGAVDGYAIDPNKVKSDIDERFGPITRAVWPTEVFLEEDEMRRRDVTVEDVARFLGGYRLMHNSLAGRIPLLRSAGVFASGDRLFDVAVPAHMLRAADCPRLTS